MRLVKILSVFAVFAAAGMILAGCDSPAGSGNGDEGASGVTSAPVHSAGGAAERDAAAVKKIQVRFKVNAGLCKNGGIVSTQDDSYLVYYPELIGSSHFTIPVNVPASDEYLNIRWRCADWLKKDDTFVKAKMKAEGGTVTLNYKGAGKVDAKNLYDVQVDYCRADNRQLNGLYDDWKDAVKRASATNR